MANKKSSFICIGLAFILLSYAPGTHAGFDYAVYSKLSLKNFRKYQPFLNEINIDSIDCALANAAVFFVTNEVRAKKKFSKLYFAKPLEVAAWNHSKSMFEEGFFSHYNEKDSTHHSPNERGALAGIANPYLAENIAESFAIDYKANTSVYVLKGRQGQFSYEENGEPIEPHTYLSLAEALVDGWMQSPPHKKNLLSKDNIALGCGLYFFRDTKFYSMPKVLATQNFQQFEPIKEKVAKDRVDW
ncbi:MAG: CAP domain-containing protein [Bacteroidales bacterium]|nr:CAP domain-containing protein [Bacteroidales bacterium]